jgi:TonB family protein
MVDQPSIFIRVKGKEVGPLGVEEVKELIDKQRFSPTDYIRTQDMTHWIMAKNLVHLKALFDAKESEQRKAAFSGWLKAVKDGAPPMVLTTDGRAAERQRIEAERQEIEAARKKLEEEETRLQAEHADEITKRSEEYQLLVAERKRLEEERERIEREEKELSRMSSRMKRSRMIPLGIAGVVVVLFLAVGIPFYCYYQKRVEEYNQKIARMDELDQKIASLEEELAKAIDSQDLNTIASISEELKNLKEERDKLKQEVGETKGETITPKEPEIETSLGTVNITGPLSIDGAGKSDLTRSPDKISTGVYGVMGSITSVYNHELAKTPGISGKVVAGFTVSGNGSVTSAYVISSSVGNSKVESAVVSALQGAHFMSSSAGDVSITYPFYFQPK